ncbi:hypothetical protein CDD82_201 [Ophiocordyceps australis]|uniref:Uncharacterized protein n=1 Tax=Ophiocordyceps australis TaxID=1399860 RepID=A0A2C5YJG1_9HYPO|nr:hypothetical protein CDD82_201 [Ophiocordyceps australis]
MQAQSGFARGEGAACLVLKRLDLATRDNDRIHSIIVNTGTNQDGRTVGLSAPNGDAQEQLIRDVYERAGVSVNDVGFVEAHGTGTKAGDPIEARALYNVFGHGRTKRLPLYIGSVKTNVGHLENVSGIVSVIKATMMLDRGFILPNVNFEKANESIPLDEWNMKVPTTLRSWPLQKRLLSVNNFGFGGSNAHCILERRPMSFEGAIQKMSDGQHKLFVLSGHSEAAARQRGKHLSIYAEQHPEAFQRTLVRDLAYTLGQRRSHMQWRAAITGSCCREMVEQLNSAAADPVRVAKRLAVAFVFTGQGAQWHAMGRELMASHSVFAEAMRAADAHLRRLGADFSLVEELARDKDHSAIDRAHISQPACTAVQLGLVQLLAAWGVRPVAVVGHSSGEIAAAFAAGLVTMEDAMALALFRGQAAGEVKRRHPEVRGAMLAVGASPEAVGRIIKTHDIAGAKVACHNSPASATVSGDASAVDAVAAELAAGGVFHRKLRVDVAYHSAHMGLVADDYHAAIRHVEARDSASAGVAFYSSLRGRRIEPASRCLDAAYWVDNLVKPVLFSPAVDSLCRDVKPTVLVEIGPHAALEGPVKQILRSLGAAAGDASYLASLVRNQDATTAMLRLAGRLFVMGQSLDFAQVNAVEAHEAPRLLDDLAPYPWTYEQYWTESRESRQHRLKPFARHDLLGLLADSDNDAQHSWRNMMRTDEIPWLRGHQMQSLVTFPLAGFLCMVAEAAAQRAALRRLDYDGLVMREVQASAPLVMTDGHGYETLLTMRRYSEGTRAYSNEWDEFTMSSWVQHRGWLEHCRGLVSVRKKSASGVVAAAAGASVGASVEGVAAAAAAGASVEGLAAAATGPSSEALARRNRASRCCSTPISVDDFYTDLAAKGAKYDGVFRLDDALHGCDEYSMAQVRLPDTAKTMPFGYETPSLLPTAFMDLVLHSTFVNLGAGRDAMPALYMPSAIKRLEFGKDFAVAPDAKVQVVAQGRADFSSLTPADFDIDAWAPADSRRPLLSLTGLKMSPILDRAMDEAVPRALCFKVQWEALDETRARVNGATTPNGKTHVNGQVNGQVNGDTSFLDAHTPIVVVTSRSSTDALVAALSARLTSVTPAPISISSLHDVQAADKLCICLYELDAPLTAAMDRATFARVQHMLLAASAVLWASSGSVCEPQCPEKATTLGLLRCLRSEAQKPAVFIDLAPASPLDVDTRSALILAALEQALSPQHHAAPRDYEFAQGDGATLLVPRIVEDAHMNQMVQRKTQPCAVYTQPFEQPARRFRIAVAAYGALDSLYFRDDAAQPLAADEVEIKVAATGMNFKDVVIAMGQVPSPYLGVECSGVVARVGAGVEALAPGMRVCAMTLGAYGTFARCKATSAAEMPADMAMEVAASIPVVFCTAYYGLVEIARLERHETVLIHAAAGGVGQAAIQLAQMLGADIYATVGSVDKKRFLMARYRIPEHRIWYSRDAAFGPAIREATHGRGVDVVLNSLAGDLLRETWECVAPFGRFVEIGKRDITSNSRLDMAQFERNVSFHSVDMTLVAMERPRIMERVLHKVMALVARGCLSPIGPLTVMGVAEVESALRLMQGGKSVGKIVIVPRPGEQVKATHQPSTDILSSDATYLIVGGTGGIGRSMAYWMAQHGARHIVLLSRSGRCSDDVLQLTEQCSRLGAAIHVRACDAADTAAVDGVVAELAQSLPPIRGLVHAAMVLRDVLFEQMVFDDFDAVVQPKLAGALNFDSALAHAPLDFFILLSSVAGIVGNRGQAAYAAANTFLDALVHRRRALGRPATALDLTAVSDVGYLATHAARKTQVLHTLSASAINEAEVLALLEAAVCGQVATGQCITGLATHHDANNLFFAQDARFARLCDAAAKPGASPETVSVHDEVSHAPNYEAALTIVTLRLWEKLCAILMLQSQDLDPKSTVRSYGLDSLNAIELRNWIGKELSAHLQVLELLTTGTMRDLGVLVLKKSKLKLCAEEGGGE